MTSLLHVQPDALLAASSDLASLTGNISTANSAAATHTTTIAPASADEVSGALATLFNAHGGALHTSVTQFGVRATTFATTLHSAAGAYTGTDTENAASLGALTGLLGLFEEDPALVVFALPLLVGFGVTVLLPYVAFELLFRLLGAL